jgi:hypothetical protein
MPTLQFPPAHRQKRPELVGSGLLSVALKTSASTSVVKSRKQCAIVSIEFIVLDNALMQKI